MRILLLTDSLALPREKPETCKYEETWPYLLNKDGYEILQISIGGATSIDLLGQSHYYSSFKPDVVIVQVGIVDCSPRFVTKKEKYFISKLPIIGSRLLGLLNNPWIRKLRGITYVSEDVFLNNIIKIRGMFSNTQYVYFTEIVGGEGFDKLLPNVHVNIYNYNKLLRSVATIIEYYEEGITMSDFHHLNKMGHSKLYAAITKALSIELIV